MITCKFAGGLGNNLFQFANVYAIHKKYSLPYFIDKNFDRLTFDGLSAKEEKRFTQSSILEIPYLFDNNFIYLDQINYNKANLHNYTHFDLLHDNHRFNPPILIKENIEYHGYFLSYKYFQDVSLRDEWIVNKQITQNLNDKYKSLFEKKTISLHYRLGGDRKFENVQNFHKNLEPNYYKDAINIILEKENSNLEDYNILLFSDEKENAIKLLKELKISCIPIYNNDNVEDFIHMSLCTHNIIGNSTFSWWAAFLNKNTNGIVVAPKTNFVGPCLKHIDFSDLFPPEWFTL